MSFRNKVTSDELCQNDYSKFLNRLSIQSKSIKIPPKSDDEIKKERLEQGFCLYFNSDLNKTTSYLTNRNLPYPKASSSLPVKGRTRSAPLNNKGKDILRKTWYPEQGISGLHNGNLFENDKLTEASLESNQINYKNNIEGEVNASFDKLIISSDDMGRLNESLKFDDKNIFLNDGTVKEDLVFELPHVEDDSIKAVSDPVEKVVKRINLLNNNQLNKLKETLKVMREQLSDDKCFVSRRKTVVSAPYIRCADQHLILRLLSNHGNFENIGLTGIQFIENNNEIRIKEIFSENLSNLAVSVLANNFNKTIKKRHMWMCPISKVPLDIHLVIGCDHIQKVMMKIWNFNFNKSLDIGVKDFEVYSLNSNSSMTLLHKGILNKGCGNPVFNYESNINFSTCARGDLIFFPAKNDHKEGKNESNNRSNNDNKNDESSSIIDSANKDLGNSLLEKSWNSINFFDRVQAGRISTCETSRKRAITKYSSFDNNNIPGTSHFNLPRDQMSLEETENDSLAESHEFNMDIWTDWASLSSKKRKKPCPDVLKIQEQSQLAAGLSLVELKDFDSDFTIKELPSGKELIIDVLSTWGDQFYVGLTGVEIFDENGNEIGEGSVIEADPSNINVLPEYEDDPRVVENLIDGFNQTRDDIHMWLTPFTEKTHHLIKITFKAIHNIAMIRIWNYNKSRVHASRGSKEVVMYLDKDCIFQGEITRATGLEPCNSQVDECNETVLFTTNEHILEKVAANDSIYRLTLLSPIEETSLATIRPKTTQNLPESQQLPQKDEPTVEHEQGVEISNFREEMEISDDIGLAAPQNSRSINLRVLSRWNDKQEGWLAFDAIQFLDENMKPVEFSQADYFVDDVKCGESVLNMIGDNSDVHNSWFGAFSENHKHEFRFELKRNNCSHIKYIKIWNCNTSPEECAFGMKTILVKMNNNETLQLIRKGPGHNLFDHGQILSLEKSSFDKNNESNLPFGFIFQMNIFKSWCDLYYVGLNGVQFLDENCEEIPIVGKQVYACPASVNDLGDKFMQTCNDVRTPDKLVDGVISGKNSSSHSWLAPILPDQVNKVYFVFDEPKYVSGIKLWNYSKTPERGVKDFAFLVDGLIIKRFCLPKVSQNSLSFGCGIIPQETVVSEDAKPCTISFDPDLYDRRKIKHDNVSRDITSSASQNVKLTNIEDGINKIDKTRKAYANQALRPFTSCRAFV